MSPSIRGDFGGACVVGIGVGGRELLAERVGMPAGDLGTKPTAASIMHNSYSKLDPPLV